MYLLLDANKVIIHISPTLGYQENGNVLVNHDSLAYAAILVDEVAEVADVPAEVAPQKYKYADGAFVLNPDYIEPLPDEVGALQGALAETREQLAAAEAGLREGVNSLA